MRSMTTRRGSALITAMLAVSAFLIYSNTLTMRAVSQRLAVERARQGEQARTLAQAAVAQLLEELNEFVNAQVNQDAFSGDMAQTTQWLRDLGTRVASASDGGGTPSAVESPAFELVQRNRYGLGLPNSPRRLRRRPGQPLNVALDRILPSTDVMRPQWQPRAWIAAVQQCNQDPMDDPDAPLSASEPLCVVLRGEASIEATHKAVEAVYAFRLGNSRVFDYAYFLNNYGWFDSPAGYSWIAGEVRSNGNLRFTATGGGNNYVLGDLYASSNSELGDGAGQPGEGTISATPDTVEYDGWDANGNGVYDDGIDRANADGYWRWASGQDARRPIEAILFPEQPPIGGTAPAPLPHGFGWDSTHRPDPSNPSQEIVDLLNTEPSRYERQQPQTIPYMGDLSVYEGFAAAQNGSLGYNAYDGNGNGVYGEAGDVQPIDTSAMFQNGVYIGKDGIAGNTDDAEPLVLWGTQDAPIQLNGPVVVPGDVIVRGYVEGQGSIFSGRNVHIVGDVLYRSLPRFTATLARNRTTGELRVGGGCWLDTRPRGWVCDDGRYYNVNQCLVLDTADPNNDAKQDCSTRAVPADCIAEGP